MGRGPLGSRSPADPVRVVILAGVAGAGKTTVGRLLASRLGWRFLDGDDLHPRGNLEKMSQGTPLTDRDRESWLAGIRWEVIRALDQDRPAVVACSALKKRYVDFLTGKDPRIACVLLEADYAVARERLDRRTSHFFPTSLLKSQFEDLEAETFQWAVDACSRPGKLVGSVENLLGLKGGGA